MNKIKSSSNKELQVLRVNCIERTPSSIEHFYTVPSLNLLALCRSNNSIELWNTFDWIQLIQIPGIQTLQTRRVLLSLINSNESSLINQIRLFTSGLNGYLIEWDLIKLKPKYTYKNPGGCIWDIALKEKLCLIGPNDGSPRIVKLKSASDPYLIKQFPKTDSRILSVCWEDNSKAKGNDFYTGHSNGTIMKWAFDTLQTLLTLKVENSNDILIWSLCSINPQFLIAGDSTGRLLIYDVSYGVLVKEFKEHTADIMAIVKSIPTKANQGHCVYFTGIDSLVCSIQLNTNTNEWLLTSSFRGQSHDINALAMIDNDTLISGGVTTDICIYHIINGCLYQKYNKKTSTSVKRHISPFDQRTKCLSVAYVNEKTIMILHQQLTSCDLWLVNCNQSVFLAKISPKSSNEYNILSSVIDYNEKGKEKGISIAMSYNNKTVLFIYDMSSNEVKKVKAFEFQSNYIFFNEDTDGSNGNGLICVSQSNAAIYLINPSTYSILKTMKLKRNQSILSCQYNKPNRLLVYSTLNKEVYCINMQSYDSSPLPHPDQLITQIKCLTNSKEVLLITNDNRLYIVNTESSSFNQWTTKRIELNDYPSNYLTWYNKVFGAAIVNEHTILLYTDYNYIKVDLNKELPKECIIEKQRMEKYLNSDWDKQIKEYHRCMFDKEYKQYDNKESIAVKVFGKDDDEFNGNGNGARNNKGNDNFKIVSRYNAIMLMEMMPNDMMIVIENDWNRIVKTFPGSVVRKRYGH